MKYIYSRGKYLRRLELAKQNLIGIQEKYSKEIAELSKKVDGVEDTFRKMQKHTYFEVETVGDAFYQSTINGRFLDIAMKPYPDAIGKLSGTLMREIEGRIKDVLEKEPDFLTVDSGPTSKDIELLAIGKYDAEGHISIMLAEVETRASMIAELEETIGRRDGLSDSFWPNQKGRPAIRGMIPKFRRTKP